MKNPFQGNNQKYICLSNLLVTNSLADIKRYAISQNLKEFYVRLEGYLKKTNSFSATNIIEIIKETDSMATQRLPLLLITFRLVYSFYKKQGFLIEEYYDFISSLCEGNYILTISDKSYLPNIILYDSTKIDFRMVQSIQDYINIIDQEFKNSEYLFYRGHADLNYQLLPTLMRDEKLLKNERVLYNRLLMRKTMDFTNCKTYFEHLVRMQHYALATRLLDITTNPLVALYFAVNEQYNKTGEVVVFKEREEEINYGDSDSIRIAAALSRIDYTTLFALMNGDEDALTTLLLEIKKENPGFERKIAQDSLNKVYTVYANYLDNERINRQSGAFLIATSHYTVLNSMEEKVYRKNRKRLVIAIDGNSKKKLLKSLDKLDFNAATLYTDVDSVSNYIKTSILEE